MAFLSGSAGQVKTLATITVPPTAATIVMDITGWDMTIESGEIDVTNTGSSGGQEFISDGILEASGSFSGFWDSAAAKQPTDVLYFRGDLTEFSLLLTTDGTVGFSFNAVCPRVPVTSEVKAGIKWSVEYRSTSAIIDGTYPANV